MIRQSNKSIIAIFSAIFILATLAGGCRTTHSPQPATNNLQPIPASVGATTNSSSSDTSSYNHWTKRSGPAYPGDFWRSWGRDGKEFAPRLWDDAIALTKNKTSLIGLALAGAAGITLSGANADDDIQRHYEKHDSQLNTFWDTVGDAGGNPGIHFALAGAMYFSSLAAEENRTYETSKTLLRALALNGMATMALKYAARFARSCREMEAKS